jgi:hypothetical protein
VVHVPDADGVHAIVPDGAAPKDIARSAIALVLDLDPAQVGIELIDVAEALTTGRP